MTGHIGGMTVPPIDENEYHDVRDAVLGRAQIGHGGLVQSVRELRTKQEEEIAARIAGDKRLWERVEAVARKVDRIVWVAAGSSLGGALTGGGLVAWLTSSHTPVP